MSDKGQQGKFVLVQNWAMRIGRRTHEIVCKGCGARPKREAELKDWVMLNTSPKRGLLSMCPKCWEKLSNTEYPCTEEGK